MTTSNLNAESLCFAATIRDAARSYSPDDRAAALVNATDCIGVASAGFRRAELARLMNSGLVSATIEGPCALLGSTLRCRPHEAALVNAVAANLDDFDDDETELSIAHVSVPTLVAAIAAAGLKDVSGAQVLDAYTAGVSAMVAIGALLNPDHYRLGWHSSATHGVIGATVAAGTILDLSTEELATALSFAVTAASGSRSAFGSDAKPLQLAHACASGVSAVLLARAGLTANTSLFTHMGLIDLYGGRAEAVPQAMARLSGRPFVDPGVTIKAYPCCTATHPAIDAAARIRARQGAKAAEFWRDIASVRVEVGAGVPGILIHSNPQTALEAKFSLEFTTAAALCLPAVNLDTFVDAMISDPAVSQVMKRCAMVGRPDQSDNFLTRVTVTMMDGSVHDEIVTAAEGSPARPASQTMLHRKLVETCQGDGEAAWRLLAMLADAPSWAEFEAELLPLLRK